MTQKHWSDRCKIEPGDRVWLCSNAGVWRSVIFISWYSCKHERSAFTKDGFYRLTDYFVGAEADLVRASKGKPPTKWEDPDGDSVYFE